MESNMDFQSVVVQIRNDRDKLIESSLISFPIKKLKSSKEEKKLFEKVKKSRKSFLNTFEFCETLLQCSLFYPTLNNERKYAIHKYVSLRVPIFHETVEGKIIKLEDEDYAFNVLDVMLDSMQSYTNEFKGEEYSTHVIFNSKIVDFEASYAFLCSNKKDREKLYFLKGLELTDPSGFSRKDLYEVHTKSFEDTLGFYPKGMGEGIYIAKWDNEGDILEEIGMWKKARKLGVKTPNFCDYYFFGYSVLVMEKLGTLDSSDDPMDVCLSLLEDIQLYTNHMVHSDIKPGNIMKSLYEEKKYYLIDWGIATTYKNENGFLRQSCSRLWTSQDPEEKITTRKNELIELGYTIYGFYLMHYLGRSVIDLIERNEHRNLSVREGQCIDGKEKKIRKFIEYTLTLDEKVDEEDYVNLRNILIE